MVTAPKKELFMDLKIGDPKIRMHWQVIFNILRD